MKESFFTKQELEKFKPLLIMIIVLGIAFIILKLALGIAGIQ